MIGIGAQRIFEIYSPDIDPDDISVAEKTVDMLVRVKLNPNQRDAVISFCESITPDEFKKCEFLRAINRKRSLGGIIQCVSLLNDYKCTENDRGGLVIDDELISRRNEEMKLFCQPVLKMVGGRDVCRG